jgi:hypothetical protein
MGHVGLNSSSFGSNFGVLLHNTRNVGKAFFDQRELHERRECVLFSFQLR